MVSRWQRFRGRRGGRFAPYVPVAERHGRAARAATTAARAGDAWQPVVIEGRQIARTPWGTAWCRHIEGFHDFSNRLPRGRTYARNGSVVDLRIDRGRVTARVAGSRLYQATVDIAPCPATRWRGLVTRCSGQIASLVELLEGRFSAAVMAEMAGVEDGLFPDLSHVRLDCSCPDWAQLCKHLAAVLYAVGARLDQSPELLFLLRGVDPAELVTAGALDVTPEVAAPELDGDLSAIFGVAIESAASPAAPVAPPAPPDGPTGDAEVQPSTGVEVLRVELLALGIAAGTISGWLASGVLRPTGRRGVYRQTAELRRRLERMFEA